MSAWDIIALITGVIGVFLTIKQSIWCWLFALISVIISVFVFYHQRLFGDLSLNIFYFISGIYGWIFWEKKKNEVFIITKVSLNYAIFLIIATIVQSILYFYLLKQFKADQVLFDSILTACSLTVTYMMIKKWIENWLLWMLIDAAYVILYLKKGMPLYAILYGFFSVMAIYGYYQWKKQLKIN